MRYLHLGKGTLVREDEILGIVRAHGPEEYPAIIEKEKSWPVFDLLYSTRPSTTSSSVRAARSPTLMPRK